MVRPPDEHSLTRRESRLKRPLSPVDVAMARLVSCQPAQRTTTGPDSVDPQVLTSHDEISQPCTRRGRACYTQVSPDLSSTTYTKVPKRGCDDQDPRPLVILFLFSHHRLFLSPSQSIWSITPTWRSRYGAARLADIRSPWTLWMGWMHVLFFQAKAKWTFWCCDCWVVVYVSITQWL